MPSNRSSIYDESLQTLRSKLQSAGYPVFRCQQVLHWAYQRRVTDWDAMRNLPQTLKTWLEEHFCLRGAFLLKQETGESATKLLLQLQDNALIETVILSAPGAKKNSDDRTTVCLSTQVGCAHGCRFCASGLQGFQRNLTVGEILAQLLFAPRPKDAVFPADNIVFMGMGEPLANYHALIGSLQAIQSDWGFGMSGRRVTVSTSGVAPFIYKLADEADVDCRLAVSLHATTNAIRDQIMPINARYPLEELFPALHYYLQKKKHRLTFEYILIKGINDSPEDARRLVTIAHELEAYINVIPYNPVTELKWECPSLGAQRNFLSILEKARVPATLRIEKGARIAAACGQLRLRQHDAH